MSRFQHGLACLIAIVAGASPLIWVTVDEYRVQARAYPAVLRADLVERARELMEGGRFEELDAFVRDVRERYPDDDALAEQLVELLMRGTHTRQRSDGAGA